MHIIPAPPAPAAPPAPISHTLMLRLRARAAAERTAGKTGLPIDVAAVERAVVGVYRATGSRHEGVRMLHDILDAMRNFAAGQGGGESA